MIKIYIDTVVPVKKALCDIFESVLDFDCVDINSADIVISACIKKNYDSPTVYLGIDVSLPVKAQILIKYIRAVYDSLLQSVPITRGCITLYLHKQTLHIHDTVFYLTQKESEIIKVLLLNGAVHRDTLLERVWHYDKRIDTYTANTHIYRLRKKCGADFIITNEKGTYSLRTEK